MPCIRSLPSASTDSLGVSDFVFNETPAGNTDGVNTFFQTTEKYRSGTLKVYLDGTQLTEKDFVEGVDSQSFVLVIDSSDSQRLNKPPCNDEDIRVEYIKQSQVSGCIINI